jgi:uroporphyrinogen-III decarboxylase
MSDSALAQHNQEVAALWHDFHEGRPARVPCHFNFGTQYRLLTPWMNPQPYSFRQYFEDPAVQWEVQLTLRKWVREQAFQDAEMGLPEEWPGLGPDYQNTIEAEWLGCRLEYREGEVPDSWPRLRDRKGDLAAMSIPDPIHDGVQARGVACYQYFEERRQREGFEGRPVGRSSLCGGGTDGPFTVACNLRGTTEVCLDLYEDPRYARELLDFVTEATIVRLKAVMKFSGTEFPQAGWGFADDSIMLLSEAQYREFVLPCHQRLLSAFSLGGPNSIHLCGRVQHLLPMLQKELNIQDFDLGFPVDLGQVRKDLGPGAMLHGNLHPMVLRDGPVSLIRQKTAAILGSGVMEGGRYVFGEGNNVAPGTPVEHFQAAYETVKAVGAYDG